MKVIKKKIFYITLMTLLTVSQATLGQVNTKDFTGSIKKYNTTFTGIGPEVYFLPKPKSKIESLTDQYQVIAAESILVKKLFIRQELIKNFKDLNNEQYIKTLIANESLRIKDWQIIIDKELEGGNQNIAIGLLNNFAKEYLIVDDIEDSEILLEKALQISPSDFPRSEKRKLLSNLFSIYLHNNKLKKANDIEESIYKEAQQNKSLQDQANSLIKLAQIDAYQQEYKLAEATIIKKAIPLLNRSKDYDGKVLAWIKLADIYISNKQYTEAQWFLIQAQELANSKELNRHLATIEYMLGDAKYYQNNIRISQQELGRALKLAQDNENTYIELLTTQRLGQISLKQNRIKDAESFLKSYWIIRSKLF